MGPGPFYGYCVFDDHEEVDVYPIYYDPVHDFGFLRFEPNAIRHMTVASLDLRPDLAKIGLEIRVVGNDAGEKLSILSGVISRLDRNAPDYGYGYCDFNTNYIQAATSNSGGSSGSPVVNIDGFVVALHAGGRSDGAATNYFLPLDRPSRALKCIQNGMSITRGTIQTQWKIKPFDECRRLGLKTDWESAVRANIPKETGMLVAEIVLPEGPSDNKIEEGDVLVKINGELLTQFVHLDSILDSSVGGKVELLLQRRGEDIVVEVQVGDLHKITPDCFVSVAGAIFHDLSYQQARLYAVACKGVFVCDATAFFRTESRENGWIIQSIDYKTTVNLQTFIDAMKRIPDRARIVVTYRHLRDPHTLENSIIDIDRHWSSKMRLAVRNDVTGLWNFTDLADALPQVPPVPCAGKFIQLKNAQYPAAADIIYSFVRYMPVKLGWSLWKQKSAAANIVRSSVRVMCYMPINLDGSFRKLNFGMGIVVDAGLGLVIVNRTIVPHYFCDISITIAESIIVEGSIVFMHPSQNYALIKYDPALVNAPVESARLSNEYVTQGDSTCFVGYNHYMNPVIAQTKITDIVALSISETGNAPRYRALNIDYIMIDTELSNECKSGVLIGEDGLVHALWLTFLGESDEYFGGLATPTLLPVIQKIQEGESPKLRMLNIEFGTIDMSQARIMGVSEEWINKVTLDNPFRHQLYSVRKKSSQQSNETGSLLEGDIILTLNGKIITRNSGLDVMFDHDTLEAVIVRDCIEMNVQLTTLSADDLETSRVLSFCGAILQSPHNAVRQRVSKLHSNVYVSASTRGSPAHQYKLEPTEFVTQVNGKPTPDLECFVNAVVKIPDNTCKSNIVLQP